MRRHLQRVVLLILVGLLSLSLAPSPVVAGEPGVLEGQVVNGTPEGGAPANLEVVLHVFAEGRETQELRATTEGEGRFLFRNVPTGPAFQYMVTTVYQGVSYYSVPLATLTSPLSLTVYDVTRSSESLSLASHLILVTDVQQRNRNLYLLEMATIQNSGTRTFVSDMAQPGMNLLRFALPAGSMHLDVQSDLPEGQFLQVDKGFAMTNPVPPGRRQVVFSYTLNYRKDILDLGRSFPYGVETLRTLVPKGLANLQGSDLSELSPVSMGPRTYRAWEWRGVPAGTSVPMGLAGLPQPTLWQRALEVVANGSTSVLIIPLLLSMALLGALVYTLRRRGAPALGVPGGQGAAAPPRRQELIEAIARLDDSFAAGKLAGEEYQGQRAALKERLLRLTFPREDR